MEDGCVKRGDLVDSVTAEFFIVIFFRMDMFSAKNSRIIARSFFNIFFFFYLSKNRYVLPIYLKQMI